MLCVVKLIYRVSLGLGFCSSLVQSCVWSHGFTSNVLREVACVFHGIPQGVAASNAIRGAPNPGLGGFGEVDFVIIEVLVLRCGSCVTLFQRLMKWDVGWWEGLSVAGRRACGHASSSTQRCSKFPWSVGAQDGESCVLVAVRGARDPDFGHAGLVVVVGPHSLRALHRLLLVRSSSAMPSLAIPHVIPASCMRGTPFEVQFAKRGRCSLIHTASACRRLCLALSRSPLYVSFEGIRVQS